MTFPKFLSFWPVRILCSMAACAVAIPAYLILLISVIGIPLALIIMFVPAAAALHISAELLHRFVFRGRLSTKAAVAASVAVPILAAIIVAQSANMQLDARTKALAAGDRDAISDAPIRRLALVDRPSFDKNKSECRDLCRRLLMSGAVTEVLVAGAAKPVDNLDQDLPATAFRFARKSRSCEMKPFEDDREPVRGQSWSNDSAKIARARIAGGDCLEARAARLGAADAALVTTLPADGSVYAARLKFHAFGDAIRANRIAFFRKDGDAFREEHRRTAILVHRHPPIAIPAILNGYAFETEFGFLRFARRLNFEGRYEEKPNRAAFLVEKIRMDLSLSGEGAPDTRRFVDAYIAGADAGSEAAKGVIADFIDSLDSNSRRPLGREDAARLLALLTRESIELPANAATAARLIGAFHPDLAPEAATALLNRIGAAAPSARHSRYGDNLIAMAARAIAQLPDVSVVSNRARILQLLGDEERRGLAAPVFALLAGAPDSASGDLLAVVDAAIEDRSAEDDDGWRDLYRSGLLGLCRAAPAAARDQFLSRFNAVPELRRYQRDLTITMLIKLGVAPDAVRTLFAEGLKDDDLQRLDFDINQAQKRPQCA